jgi:hypothetical protein
MMAWGEFLSNLPFVLIHSLSGWLQLLLVTFLEDSSCSWHLLLSGVTIASSAILSQLHTSTSQGTPAGNTTLLHIVWSLWLAFGIWVEAFMTSSHPNSCMFRPVKPALCGQC